jgi:hypothetical protein
MAMMRINIWFSNDQFVPIEIHGTLVSCHAAVDRIVERELQWQFPAKAEDTVLVTKVATLWEPTA